MAVTRDWIPKQIHKFKVFADNLCKRASKNSVNWHLDSDEVTALLGWQRKFNRYFKISTIKNTHSQRDNDNTKNARKTYQKLLRKMGIGRMKNNLFMTNIDKMGCGLNIGEKGYTLSPVALVSPLIDYKSKGNLGGQVISMDPASHKPCKPVGQKGIKIAIGYYKMDDPIPKEVDCTLTVMLSKSFGNIVFPSKKYGYCFVGYARYFNTRNIQGMVATRFYGTVV